MFSLLSACEVVTASGLSGRELTGQNAARGRNKWTAVNGSG